MDKKGFTPAPIVKKQLSFNEELVRGFTLLEIIVSTVILALVIAGMANIFVVGKRRIVSARSKIQGAELGRLFLDPLQGQVRQDQWGSNCLSNNTSCSQQPQPLDNINYTPAYNISTISVGVGNTLLLRKVKVTITWNETAP